MLNKRLKIKYAHNFIALAFYYGIFRWMPSSLFPILGPAFKMCRYLCCKVIFRKLGRGANIERGAIFGCGFDVEIGDKSGIGINCVGPSNIIIGKYVNMGPNVYILSRNHKFNDPNVIMQHQGYTESKQTIIGDDVWIGRQVIFTPGRIVKNGSIIGAGCVLCKDFPEYSIVGGNPSQLIKNRR